MKQMIHREKFMFDWITKNHKLVAGFERVKHRNCSRCGKTIYAGSTLCDNFFKREKRVVRNIYC